MKRLALLVSSIILATTTNCNSNRDLKSKHIRSTKTFNSSLVKQHSNDSIFVISLPKNYKLKGSQGIDFNTYYFSPSDNKDSISFRGGIYLGNHPNYFIYQHCLPKDINAHALGEPCVWQLDSCKTKFCVQVVAPVKNNSGWNSQIHLFGSARFKNDIDKLLDVFSTLEMKRKKADESD